MNYDYNKIIFKELVMEKKRIRMVMINRSVEKLKKMICKLVTFS